MAALFLVGDSVGEKVVGIDELDITIIAKAVNDIEVIKGEDGDGETGVIPEFGDFRGEERPVNGDQFDARLFGEGNNVFWGPVGILV